MKQRSMYHFIITIVFSLAVFFNMPLPASAASNPDFKAPRDFPAGTSPRSLASADLDGDGKQDLVTANLGSNTMSVLLGAGDGTFAAPVGYGTGRNPRGVVAVDVDNDGDSDIVTANSGADNSVSVLKNNGDGTFATKSDYPAGTSPIALTAGNLNADGYADLVTANFNGSNVSVLLNDGTGAFAAPVNYIVGTSPYGVTLSDLDGDGDRDMAVANRDSNNMGVLKNNGDGTFAAQVLYGVGESPYCVTSGDLDGDGDRDLVTANWGHSNVSVLKNNGNGTFTMAVNFLVGLSPVSVMTGDLDSDGDLDLSVANVDDHVMVLKNNGNGTFAVAVSYIAGSRPYGITVGYLDGDSHLDLATSNDGSHNVSVFLGKGDGSLMAAAAYPVGTSPRGLTSGDLNGDGKLDLVTADYGGGNVSVVMGDGNGAFGAPASYMVGTYPIAVATGDLDGDGDRDMAVVNFTSSNMSVLMNNGNGTFATAVTYATGGGPYWVVAGNVDGDADLDLVTANSGNNSVSVFRNNGSGVFTRVNYATGTSPYSVAVADLDKDNDLDLATANQGGNDVSVLKNNGSGSFSAAVSYTAGTNPYSVTAGDLNADGNLDLVTANYGGNNVSVLLGTGGGVFAAPVNYAAGTTPNSLTAGDFDADGDLDLVTANGEYNDVSLLTGNGDGTFAAPVHYITGWDPMAVITADLDGDTDLDLVTVNYTGNDVGVLLNGGNSEIAVYGNGLLIADGDTTPSAIDDTDFGSLMVWNATRSHTFTISNSGTGELNVSGISFAGAAAADFSLSGISLPAVVPAGGSVTFQVIFDPTAPGLRGVTLEIANNDNNQNPYDFAMQGTGRMALDDAGAGFASNEDTAFTTGNVLANDQDPSGNPPTLVSYDDSGLLGLLVFNGDGTFEYDPDGQFEWLASGETAVDVFTYVASAGVLTDSATVSISVNGVNDAPMLDPVGDKAVGEGSLLAFTATASDPDLSDALRFSLGAGAPTGASIDPDSGAFTWTPAEAQGPGLYALTLRVSDGSLEDAETISITVNEVNLPPLAVADSYNTTEEVVLNVAAPGVLANDSDGDVPIQTLSAVLDTAPAVGELAFEEDGSFVYTPTLNFFGDVSFTYFANDGEANSEAATVTMHVAKVNDAPVAVDDDYLAEEDTLLSIAAPGVLANDIEVDGDPLEALLVSDVSSGTLALEADGSFTYLPDANINGVDSFTYYATDGALNSLAATVVINITPVNDAPVAVDDFYSLEENTVLSVDAPGFAGNDYDVDGDELEVGLVSGVSHGILNPLAGGGFVYTPDLDFNGIDSFQYRVNDGLAFSDIATVTLTVNPLNSAPVVVEDAYSLEEETVLSVTVPGVLANDSDPEGDAMTATLVTDVMSGTLVFNLDGSFVYTPTADFFGVDLFTYLASDGLLESNPATVTLTVTNVNDLPLALADTFSMDEDTVLNVNAPGVLANDSDMDGDVLTATLVTEVVSCTLVLNADGSFTYTPDADFFGVDSFTYMAFDGVGTSEVVTVAITVHDMPEEPTVRYIFLPMVYKFQL